MYLLLANPEAGGKRFQKIKSQLVDYLNKLGVKFDLVELVNLVDAEEAMKKHIQHATRGVIAIGGNATVNTVINSMADEGMPFGIIPIGKTNYLAHSLGIKGWRNAAKLLADPDKIARRLGKIGKHYFVDKIEILGSHNLLSKYLKGEGFIKKFIGSSTPSSEKNAGVNTTVSFDDGVRVTTLVQKISARLNDEKGGKKILLEITTDDPKSPTRLWMDELEIEGDKKMPVLMGNETVAHTPVEIKGCSKYIELLIPKLPAKLAKSRKK